MYFLPRTAAVCYFKSGEQIGNKMSKHVIKSLITPTLFTQLKTKTSRTWCSRYKIRMSTRQLQKGNSLRRKLTNAIFENNIAASVLQKADISSEEVLCKTVKYKKYSYKKATSPPPLLSPLASMLDKNDIIVLDDDCFKKIIVAIFREICGEER